VKNEEFYISLAGEIFDGYTECEFNGRLVYLKHLTIKDQRYLSLYYDKYKQRAINRGVKTEEEVLLDVKNDGLWSDDDDVKIETLSSEIENLKKTQSKLFLRSQQEGMQKTIDKKESEHLNLLSTRKQIIGKTAEDYASNMSVAEMIRYFVFDSPKLKKHAFSSEDFDEMSDDEVIHLRLLQKNVNNRMDELTIQETVLRPFFGMYLSFCENPRDFFGKPIVDLSVFQMKLVLFGKIFHSIFQYTEEIPDHIKEDPEKLLAFSEAKQNKSKGAKSFINDDAAGSTVFGGTSEDIKDLAQGSENTVSLSEEIRKAGGTLTMEQMIKLAGD